MGGGVLMRSTRLLVVVPAAAALVFGGLAPASAHDKHHGHDGHHGHHQGHHAVRADVDYIGDHARADRDKVKVSFVYDCEDNRHSTITADVTLWQDHSRYSNSVSVPCNVWDKYQEVWLYEQRDDLDNGYAKVNVKLRDGGTWLHEKAEPVWVSGADRRHHYDKYHHNHH